MKEGIHPNYYQATVTCNCGNTFVTGSTKEDIHVEICSKCHAFYTGQQKAAQARGRIDKFNKKYGVNTPRIKGSLKNLFLSALDLYSSTLTSIFPSGFLTATAYLSLFFIITPSKTA